MASIADALGRAVAETGDRPCVTYRDAASGERTELGCATLANWAHKTADALAEEGVGRGGRLTVATDGHWTAPVSLWAAGLLGAAARLAPDDADVPADDVAVVAEGRADTGAALRLAVGAGLGGRPLGGDDGEPFADVALAGADLYDGPEPDLDEDWLLAGDGRRWWRLTAGNVLAAAEALRGWGLARGERVLLAGPVERPEHAVLTVAATLAGAGVVLVRGGPAAAWRAVAEERCGWVAADAAALEALLGAEGPGVDGVVALAGAPPELADRAAAALDARVCVGSGLLAGASAASLTPRDQAAATAAWLAAQDGAPAGAVLPPGDVVERDGRLDVVGPLRSPGPVDGAEPAVDGAVREGPDGRRHVLLR